METAHVVMLQQICKMNDIPTPKLDNYVNNREAHLISVMELYQCTIDAAKLVFLVAMLVHSHLAFYKELIKETRGIAKYVAAASPDIAAHVLDKNNATKYEYVSNKNGNVMSHFLQEIEHQCLNQMFLYCAKNGYIVDNNCSLQADGIMIPADNYENKILKNLNKHILKTIGLDIVFTQKKMKDDYLDILDEHLINVVAQTLTKKLPNLEKKKPQVEGQ